MIKIATWNVNSIRVRSARVLQWLIEHKPDVLALQETKIPDADFPVDEIRKAGYEVIYNGQKSYNGVAILSRMPFFDVVKDLAGFDDPQRRFLAATVQDLRIINLYIPNGQSVGSDQYQYKLDWLRYLKAFLMEEIQRYPKLIAVGDFNIAPEDQDVHEPLLWQGRVLCSEAERAILLEIVQCGLRDCFRIHTQPDKSFTWWDYRLNAFKRNMGLRIDHIFASLALSNQCIRCYIDKNPRGEERPSDHAPVIAEFEVT